MTETTTTAAVEKAVTVPLDQARAFELFTRDAVTWWPIDTHAINAGEVRDLVWEEQVGGGLYEISTTGERCHWATVLTWDPPHRLVVAWHVNPDRVATELEVRFVPDGDATRVELEHRGWELAVDGAEARARYDTGWEHVLARYVAAV